MLSTIRSKVRELTGKPSTSQISDASINTKINAFYQDTLPLDINSDLLNAFYTLTLTPVDSGDYTLPSTVLTIKEPIQIGGNPITLTTNQEWFNENYPKDSGSAYVLSDAGAQLARSTGTPAKVAHAAFYYKIGENAYLVTANSTGVALSGSTIPQAKYGAWRLEVNAAGTVSIVAAAANATGYSTPALAIKGLSAESATSACMGFVVAVNVLGTFIPDTTALNAAGVVATFTDGFHTTRNVPDCALYFNRKLYVRPKPNDWMELKAPYVIRPSSLSSDSSTALDSQWEDAIAYGAAIEILISERRLDKAGELKPYYDYAINKINQKCTKQENVTRRVKADLL